MQTLLMYTNLERLKANISVSLEELPAISEEVDSLLEEAKVRREERVRSQQSSSQGRGERCGGRAGWEFDASPTYLCPLTAEPPTPLSSSETNLRRSFTSCAPRRPPAWASP